MRSHSRNRAVHQPGGPWTAELTVPHREKTSAWEPARELPVHSSPCLPRTRHSGLSDCGPHRARNEDAFLADERLGLFIVCDGVGGRRSGEIAAGEAISIIQAHVSSATISGSSTESGADESLIAGREASERNGLASHSMEAIRGIVRSAMQQASRAIFDLGAEDFRYAGMCTTASVVLIVGELAVIGQVGDTRVYHASGHSTRQLTKDHTLLSMRVQQGLLDAERAKNRKSPITRALGLRDSVEVDICAVRLMAGDRLLLCTDGLHDHLEPEAVLTRLLQMDPHDAALAAIGHARRCGGKDNATAIFVEALGHA